MPLGCVDRLRGDQRVIDPWHSAWVITRSKGILLSKSEAFQAIRQLLQATEIARSGELSREPEGITGQSLEPGRLETGNWKRPLDAAVAMG